MFLLNASRSTYQFVVMRFMWLAAWKALNPAFTKGRKIITGLTGLAV